jgi:hypothetical protein
MDFVQRNLINERNNLQIELAKANILIAQLSEGKLGDAVEKIKVRVKQAFGGPSPKEIEIKKRSDAYWKNARALPPAPKDSRSWPIGEYSYPDSAGTKNEVHEQAQYISSLENAVIALAESMNMSAEELIEELKTPRSLKKMADIARAVSSGTHQPLGNNIPRANRLALRMARNLEAHGVLGAHVVGDQENDGDRERIVISRLQSDGRPHRGPHGFEPVGAETPIQFDNPNMSLDNKIMAGRNAQYQSKAAREARINRAEQQSRTFESMNMSAEDLLNEGEARNRRIASGLNNAAMKIGAGKKRLEMMDQHVSNVAKTQGGEAGNVADIAVSRLRGPTERGVRDAQAKSGKLETALNTGMAAVKRSRVKRQTNGLFSNSLNKAKQGERVGSISGGMQTSQKVLHTRETPKTYMNPKGGQEVTTGTVVNDLGYRSGASLAAQGKLPVKKFGTGADQKTNLAAMQTDSAAKRAAQAQAQSTAAKARNNTNKPV